MEFFQALLLQTEKWQDEKHIQEVEEVEKRQDKKCWQEAEEAEKWQDKKHKQEADKMEALFKTMQKQIQEHTTAELVSHMVTWVNYIIWLAKRYKYLQQKNLSQI